MMYNKLFKKANFAWSSYKLMHIKIYEYSLYRSITIRMNSILTCKRVFVE